MIRRTLPSVVPLLLGALAARPAVAQDPGDAARRESLQRAAAPSSAPAMPNAPLAPASSPLRLVDLSLDLMGAFGGSSATDAELRDLQGGGHDPKQRGFTFEQAELALAGAVDPYFTARTNLVALLDAGTGESVVELEEAYVTTQQLPYGLQAKFGTYLTEFGRLNPTHPHAWDWQDQPLMHTRLFGGDGMRGPGARVSWLLPTDTFNELTFGVQNAAGENMPSFLGNEEVYGERGIGGRAWQERGSPAVGRLVYTLRGTSSLELSDTQSAAFGASAAFGPNATGDRGETLLYGIDAVWKWKPVANERGYPFVRVQAELLGRAFRAAAQTDDSGSTPVDVPGATLRDQGGYVQALYGFTPGWAAGLRVEAATGRGDSYDPESQSFDRRSDPYRADRVRISPLLQWQTSEFSRFRLQYDYDDSDALDGARHSVWLGFEVLLGAHPPHAY